MLYIFYLMHFARFPLLQVLPLVNHCNWKSKKKNVTYFSIFFFKMYRKSTFCAAVLGVLAVKKKFVKSQKSFPHILADFLRTPGLCCEQNYCAWCAESSSFSTESYVPLKPRCYHFGFILTFIFTLYPSFWHFPTK